MQNDPVQPAAGPAATTAPAPTRTVGAPVTAPPASILPRIAILSAVLHPAASASGQARNRARLSVGVRATNRGDRPITLGRPSCWRTGAFAWIPMRPRSPPACWSRLPPEPARAAFLRFETAGAVTARITSALPASLRIGGRTLQMRVRLGNRAGSTSCARTRRRRRRSDRRKPERTREPALRAFRSAAPPCDDRRDRPRRAARRCDRLLAVAQKQYTATAKLLFRDPGFDQKLLGGPVLGAVGRRRARGGHEHRAGVAGHRRGASRRRDPQPRAERLGDPRQGDGRRPGPVERRRDQRGGRRPRVRPSCWRTRSPATTSSSAGTPIGPRSARRWARPRSAERDLGPAAQEPRGPLAARSRSSSSGSSPRCSPATPSSFRAAEPPARPRRPTCCATPSSRCSSACARIWASPALDRLDRRLRDPDDPRRCWPPGARGPSPRALRSAPTKASELRLAGAEAEAFARFERTCATTTSTATSGLCWSPRQRPATGRAPSRATSRRRRRPPVSRSCSLEADLRRPTLNGLFPRPAPCPACRTCSPIRRASPGRSQQLPVAAAGAPTGMTLDVVRRHDAAEPGRPARIRADARRARGTSRAV